MNTNENKTAEKPMTTRISGWITLFVCLALFAYFGLEAYAYFFGDNSDELQKLATPLGTGIKCFILGVIIPAIIYSGNITIEPNQAAVYTFMGTYMGTLRGPGFFWAPFWWGVNSERDLTIKTVRVEFIKVNDKEGNPIVIGCDIYCREENTYAATFEISDLTDYLNSKAEVALRKLAMSHPMDNLEDEGSEKGVCLMTNIESVTAELENAVRDEYEKAGYVIVNAAITALNYAPEIAAAMLQRQQAKAMLAARKVIAAGTVAIVKDTVGQLKDEAGIELSSDNKQRLAIAMVVTLSSNQAPSQVMDLVPRESTKSKSSNSSSDELSDDDDDAS